MAHGPSGKTLLRGAGLAVWLSSGVPAAQRLLADPAALTGSRSLLYVAAFVVFGIGFWRASGTGAGRAERDVLFWLALQTGAALAMLALVCTGFESILLVLVAAQAGLWQRIPHALLWVGLQTLLVGWISADRWGPSEALEWTGGTLGFELVAMFLTAMARREALASEELARANAELRATRHLLAESQRVAERVRIARELHDVLGHELTALALQLEVAGHTASEGSGADSIARARRIAKRLLGDVRDVVSTLREDDSVDIASSLSTLVEGIARPQVHLIVPDGLRVRDPRRAQVLLRCVQETTTNAIRHAGADNLWIEIVERDGGIAVEARDDGRGRAVTAPGNGLTGMRERFEEVGGRVEYASEPERGFWIHGWLPLERSAG